MGISRDRSVGALMRVLAKGVVFGMLAVLVGPVPGFASGGWPPPVAGEVRLAYGSTYAAAGGMTCTHGGLDLAAVSGETVHSSTSGSVVFAGRVPAGEGAQAYAVTVLTPDGLRVTYLPLRSAAVAKGAHVEAGAVLGSVEDAGDPSSSGAHLHVGVRRGETRLDPAAFLAAADAAPADPPAGPAPASSGAHAPERSVEAPASAASVPSAIRAQGGASAGAPSAVPTPRLSATEALPQMAREAASALARVPDLRRIREVEAAPALNLARASADMRAGRGWVSALALRVALVLLAVGCVVPVVGGIRRAMRAASTTAVPSEPVVVREARR